VKKIVFVLPHMLCGGVEKSLLSLINEMPKEDYKITILFVKAEGEFIDLIPNHVIYEELPISDELKNDLMLGGIKKSIKYHLKTRNWIKMLKVIFNVIRKNPLATLTYNFDNLESVKETYDIAVCYHVHMPFIVRYVSEKIDAKTKLSWVHNDFENSGYKIQNIAKYMDGYNHCFCVSDQLLKEFTSLLPSFRDKTSIAYNIISKKYIMDLSKEIIEHEYKDDKNINILTIGRLDYQKGYDMAIKVCKNIIDKGYKIRWFVLGSGEEEEKILDLIKQYNLQENFILLGTRKNPYPYIRECDIYVQTSRHEGYGIAVAEARVLCKAIVCTDFTGARDQLINRKTGSIVRFEENEIANAIIELINNNEKKAFYENNLLIERCNSKDDINEIIMNIDRWS